MTNNGLNSIPSQINYDDVFLLIAELLGGSAHVGYWESPADGSTLAQACLRLTDLLVEKLGVGPGDRVLDIGCGIGFPAIRLAQLTGASVVGITNGPGQVERAVQNAADAGVGDRVSFQCADGMDLPFTADSFDAVWAIESVQAMPDRLTPLRQVARVLRLGGRLMVIDVLEQQEPTVVGSMRAAAEKLDAHGLWEEPQPRLQPIPMADYPALLERAGLVPVELIDISENTVPRTFTCMRQKMRDDRELLVNKFGAPIIELYETILPLFEAAGWGYGLVVATPQGA